MSDWVFASRKDSIGNDIEYKSGPPDLREIKDDCVAINTLGYYKSKVILPLAECSHYTKDTDGIYIRKKVLSDLESSLGGNLELQKYVLEQ